MTREQEIFEAAVAQPSREARDEYLLEACGLDADLRRSVEELLAAFDDAGQLDFLPSNGAGPEARTVLSTPGHQEGPGTLIGRYKLLQAIGEGGMGVVYMAEQEEPVRRRVALKIIKLGMDTRSVIARFEAERQALAMMDHPNIAKVLDGGATDAGRPYFVMELVRGVKITEYCDEARCSTRQRLDLFIRVCQAIQHAHQKGVIHRDIKPSNILVTLNDGQPVPKVIDFGIAKAVEGRLTDKTLFTQFEALIGTPAYMSPEQAVMTSLDIDTRTDIYSLGVLLYELLAGSTPFDAKELLASGIEVMRRTIREKEPVRPSTRFATLQEDELTTTAKRRSTGTAKLLHQLRGDLDWIVMRCLEKDRARRYETANGLAADIQRHLNHEPVVARPPSAAYRFQKLVRRNKGVFAAVVALAAVLMLGVVLSTWQAIRATRATASEAVQRRIAHAQRDVAIQQRKLADLQLALQAWDEGDLQRANDLIEASRPAPGQSPAFEWLYLKKLCQDQSIATFGDANHFYRSAMFLDRDSILLNEDKTLTLHDLSGRAKQLLLEDQDGIRNPTFCDANTNLLATATEDGRIKVWNLPARRVMVEFEGHPTSLITAITFSRNGRWLASTGLDKAVKLWEVHEGKFKPARTLHHYSYVANGIALSPEGKTLFTGGSETMIRAWDIDTGTELTPSLAGHTAWVYVMTTSPDRRWLASGSADTAVIVWDVASRKAVTRILGHIAGVTALAFSSDNRFLASGGYDQTIRIWDLSTGKQLSLLRGHRAKIWSLSFSPHARLLVSHSDDGLAKLWHVDPSPEGNSLIGSKDWLEDVAVSPDGRHVASVSVDSPAVSLWELPASSRTLLNGHSNAVMCADFSPDGKILATGSHDQTVRLWDTTHQRPVGTLNHGFPVGSLAFSPDGRTLIAGGSKYHFLVGRRAGLQFWDVPSQQANGTLPGNTSDMVGLAFSPDGSLLATGHDEGAVSLWDTRSRRLLHRFESPFQSQVISLAFSPTQPFLAASDWAGNILLYDTLTMAAILPPLKAHTFRVMSLAFSPDGRTLASAGEGGGLKLWQAATRQLALTLKGHLGTVTGVAFPHDGSFMASSGADTTVRLWPAPALAEAALAK